MIWPSTGGVEQGVLDICFRPLLLAVAAFAVCSPMAGIGFRERGYTC
jgi:hypothetical protein